MGQIKRVALKHTSYITSCKVRQPVEICSMMQGAQTWCSVTTLRSGMGWEVGGSFKR